MIKTLCKNVGPTYSEEETNKLAEAYINRHIDTKIHNIIKFELTPKYGVLSTPDHCGKGVWITINILYEVKND